MIRRTWLVVSVAMALSSVIASPVSATAVSAVSTPCDGLPDTPVPVDAVIGEGGLPTRFVADVDGDGFRDVVTGYWRGSANRDEAEHYLHVELASGWGTAFRIDEVEQFAGFPLSEPSTIVTMGGRSLIVTAVQGTLVGADYAFFSFDDCALAPVPLATGGYPRIWQGSGLMHREWFACSQDGVVMLDLFRRVDDGSLVGGEVTSYRLDPDGFRPASDSIDLSLPRTDRDLLEEFPDCSSYVGSFVDDNGSMFQAAIEWLAVEGLTRGCNPPINDRFCPGDDVTRGEMAAFLVRAFGYADDGGGDLYVDDDDSVFESAIDKMGTAGITQGCNPPGNDRFCPDDNVTRGQVAAFLKRALDQAG